MKYQDISPTLRAYLGGHEGLRKLGFSADDIHCEVGHSSHPATYGKLMCFVTLLTQGKRFRMEAGPIGTEDQDVFFADYQRVATAVRDGEVSQSALDRIWQSSKAHTHAMELITALMALGFIIPKGAS